MRLINADALLEIIKHNKKINQTNDKDEVAVYIDAVIDCIEKQPTIENQ